MSFFDAFTVWPVFDSFLAFVTSFFNWMWECSPAIYFAFSIWGMITLTRLVIEVIG